MRQAPKWRAFIPTSRELRFTIQKQLQRHAPQVLRLANIYMTQGDWDEIARSARYNIQLNSEISLSAEDVNKYKENFELDVRRCDGVFHTHSEWNIEIAEFNKAIIFGHTGQAVDSNSQTAITKVSHNFSRPYIGGRKLCIKEPCINFINVRAGEQNFYHYMVEITTMLLHIVDYFSSRLKKLIVLTRPPIRENEKIIQRYIEARYSNIVFHEVDENEHIYADCLLQHRFLPLCPFRSPCRRQDLFMLAEIYREALGISRREHKRNIYICRKDARVRKITNESKLIERLERKNFTIVAPGQLSFRNQVELFANARCVVGAHGAGLTNMMHMKPGGRVIELFGDNYVQGAYMWMSRLMGHDYMYSIAPSTGSHQNIYLNDIDINNIIDFVC